MRIVRRVPDLRSELDAARPRGRVGFVPTLGALHAGHVSLFRLARADCATVVASIFVNPKQFDDSRDFEAYPRQESADCKMAQAAGVDVLFIPGAGEMYPAGHATGVQIAGAALGFEGSRRPGHFAGVVTVCLTLFHMVRPDEAYFGQKDAQQLAVIRQLVRDFSLDLDVKAGPTVREADGVALSSRNVRLSPDERARAPAIPRALRAAVAAHRAGRDPVEAARAGLSGLEIDYVDVADFGGDRTLVVAVRLGPVRLIDNVPLDAPARAGL